MLPSIRYRKIRPGLLGRQTKRRQALSSTVRLRHTAIRTDIGRRLRNTPLSSLILRRDNVIISALYRAIPGGTPVTLKILSLPRRKGLLKKRPPPPRKKRSPSQSQNPKIRQRGY